MASNYFAIDGRDLDNVFELRAEFPNMPVTQTSSNYFVGSQDFSQRYLATLAENINTGYSVTWPATPYKPAWTEEINEGGEIIYIYHPAEPAQPAGDRDIGTIYTPKGKIANYYNYPRNVIPAPSDNTYTVTLEKPDTESGTVTAAKLFNCRIITQVINDADPIVQLVVISNTVTGGSMYQALSVSAPTKIAPQKWQTILTIGLSVTTPYTSGYGRGAVHAAIKYYTITASGKRSDVSFSPYMKPPYGVVQHTATISLYHHINDIYTGN